MLKINGKITILRPFFLTATRIRVFKKWTLRLLSGGIRVMSRKFSDKAAISLWRKDTEIMKIG